MDIRFKKRDIRSLTKTFGDSENIIRDNARTTIDAINRHKKSIIESNPWSIGGQPGGVPVDTGTLRDDHEYETEPMKSQVTVDNPYAQYVHGGTSHMEARPWLDYTVNKMDRFYDRELRDFLENITNNLAE